MNGAHLKDISWLHVWQHSSPIWRHRMVGASLKGIMTMTTCFWGGFIWDELCGGDVCVFFVFFSSFGGGGGFFNVVFFGFC